MCFYRKRSLWLLGWLVGVLWLLGGCVAPDGSTIRLQQAPDGSIVGWQLDAPAGAASGAEGTKTAINYPPRPLLYVDVWTQNTNVPIQAIDPDGSDHGRMGEGQFPVLLGWSSQGDHFAYFAVDEDTGAIYLKVAAPGEEGKRIVDYEPDELTSYWGTAQALWTPADWAPDGSRIALVRGLVEGNAENRRVDIVDIASGKIAANYPLPESLGTPFMLEWSPDGQKLLAIGDRSMIVDLKSGQWAQIRDYPAWMVWLPGSNGVLYVNYGQDKDNTGNSLPPGLWLQILGKEPQQLLTSKQLLALGLDVDQLLNIALSPAGRRLALLTSAAWDDAGTTLVVLDFAKLQSGQAAPQPLAHWQLQDAITPVQWSPDEEALAFLQASAQGVTLEVLPLSAAKSQTIKQVTSGNAKQANDALVQLINMPFQLLSWMP